MPPRSVSEHYRVRLRQTVEEIAIRLQRRRIFGLIFIAALGAALLLLILAGERALPAWTIAFPLTAVPWAGRAYGKNRIEWLTLRRTEAFYERGIARIEGRWASTGHTGLEFREADHVYDSDLQVLGKGSLFELICTVRTAMGRRRLADYLLRHAGNSEALSRQEGVRELLPHTDLRERIALLGEYQFRESTWEEFDEWISLSSDVPPSWIRCVAFASSVVTALLLSALFVTSLPKIGILILLPPFLLLQGTIAVWFRKRTKRIDEASRRLSIEIGVLREGVELISTYSFEGSRLRGIQESLRADNSASELRLLERLTNALSELDKPWFSMPAQSLILRTQICFAIASWKHRFASQLSGWVDTWSEFEALSAIAGYAYEHPDDAFPQFQSGGAFLVTEEMGHPLLPDHGCVRNDVRLDSACPFYIVSGSNMSGKSTLLRAIGLNVVLAHAGAPVRARLFVMSELDVCASLAVVDSVLEGKSKFFAEVERIRETISRAGKGPVLFLIDEILSGTNSLDRRIVAESVLSSLLDRGAVGAISTHDLALTAIAGGTNVHMSAPSDEQPLDFRLRAQTRTRDR